MEELRQDRMTPAERMNALVTKRQPDRVPFIPFALGFHGRNVGYPIAAIYNNPEKSLQAQLWTLEMYGCDGSPQFSYACYGTWEFGGEIKFPTSEWEQAPSNKRFPVESEKDVERLELPDVRTAGSLPMAMEFSKLCEQRHLPITVSAGSPFTWAGNVCGVDKLCRWMIKRPEVAHRLLRLVTDHCLQVVQYWVDTFGAKRISAFSATPTEANNVISPRQFEEFAFPYQKEVHERVLALEVRRFFCHICGEQNLNLPYFVQIPMGDSGIVSFGHEVDLATAIKYFGDKCIIAGNIEPQVILTGTPQQIYELCRKCISQGREAPRGYILMPGCELPPATPPYNVYTMMKAVKEFGWYE
jgi:uroporphyrinogen decarboxylase